MFGKTRLILTAWYLLIIMFISCLFSVVIYGNVSRQIEGLIRLHNTRLRNFRFQPPGMPPLLSIEDLEKQKAQLGYSLLLINLGIIAIAGAGGYFLAGRTLGPIKRMVEEQNQFIWDASHELRTPIATLRAEMEGKLLEKHISHLQARKLISSNLEELGRLQNLSEDLLKLTVIPTINNKLSLHDVIKTATRKVAPLAKKKKIKIVTKVPETIIKGGKDSLVQAFVILLDNAIKYSPQGSKIMVSSQSQDHKIKVLVADHGVGIAAKDLPHIFERFFRADKSRWEQEGYGLGLAIAKKIIEQHKGSIEAVSKPGQGSTFKVILSKT